MTNTNKAVPEHLSCVLSDFERSYSELSDTIDALREYIATSVSSRGVEDILYLKFPLIGKHYDKSLSQGYLTKENLGVSFFPNSPKGLGGLMKLSFDLEGNLRDTLDPSIVFYTRSILYAYKKVKVNCPPIRIQQAVDSFLETDLLLREPSSNWGSVDFVACGDTFRCWAERSGADRDLQAIAGVLDRVFSSVTPKIEIYHDDVVPRHGPGAVSDLRTGSDKYHFPVWPAKLERVFPFSMYGIHNDKFESVWDQEIGLKEGEPRKPILKSESKVSPPAKLLAVPKTYKGPRLITSEPTAHQFLQQGLNRWIRKNLSPMLRNCIDFSSQEPSRQAAIDSSMGDGTATVDLSSASDRLSCWTVERAFRSNPLLLEAINATRTHVVINGTGTSHDFQIPLRKLAGQGSATTFPIQTIVYAACCISAVLYDEGKDARSISSSDIYRASRGIRVFGDDIVLPSSNLKTLDDVFTFLQLKINWEKTHDTGDFRESCGMDAFRGYDVTPFYVSELVPGDDADAIASWICVSNNAHAKGLWYTADWMLSKLRASLTRLLPINGQTALSLLSFCRGLLPTDKIRWNEALQRMEYKTLIPTAREKRGVRSSSQNLLQYFLEHPGDEPCGGVMVSVPFRTGWTKKNSTRLTVEWVPFQ